MHHLLKLILIKCFFIFGAFPVLAQSTPSDQSQLRPSAEFRLFKRQSNWEHMLEANWHPEDEKTLSTLSASSRLLLENGYTLGPFLSYTLGERHTSDWQLVDGNWQWRDRSSYGEIHTGFLVQKRWLLNSHLSAEFRATYEYHLEHETSLARLRPGLTWQMSPSWIVYPRYELYLQLGDSPQTLYAQGVYIGSLFIDYAPLLLGPFVRYKRKEWWTSPQFSKRTGTSYKAHSTTYSLGFSVIYSL